MKGDPSHVERAQAEHIATQEPQHRVRSPSLVSEAQLERARELLAERCGLHFRNTMRELLSNGLVRAAEFEGSSVDELLAGLYDRKQVALLQRTVRQLTIGETYFFRHPEHFDAVRDVVGPWLAKIASSSKPIRAWSAGCATGEEAYSLAIELLLALGPLAKISVLGTDINRAALEMARKGQYGRWSLRLARPGAQDLLGPTNDGMVTIPERVKRLMRFDYLNLGDPCYPSLLTKTTGMHVVFCRNVLVYFSHSAIRKAAQRLAECLVPGGFLIVCPLDLHDVSCPGLASASGMAPVGVYRREEASAGSRLRGERLPTVQPQAEKSKLAPEKPKRPKPPPRTRNQSVTPAAPSSSKNPRRLAEDARLEAAGGNYARATALARKALDEEEQPETLHLLALLLAESGEPSTAASLLERAVTLDPDYVLGHVAVGLLYRSQRQEERARRHLRRAGQLVQGKGDDVLLPGPDPLPVAWVRRLVAADESDR